MPAVAERKVVFRIPVQSYDIATGRFVPADRYLNGQPLEPDNWQNQC